MPPVSPMAYDVQISAPSAARTVEPTPPPLEPLPQAEQSLVPPVVQAPLVTPDPLPDTSPPQTPSTQSPEQADVLVTARSNRGDPLAPLNVASFEATQAVDRALIGPLSRAYSKGLPKPVRAGIVNFLGNLREPIVAVNYLLQLKPGKAAETVGRFAINTTVGVAGVVDVAERKPFRLPRRRNSFANTLGLYGVGPGPFFFLPLIGPTTLRDLLGSSVDQVMVPISSVPPLNDRTTALAIGGASALSYRAQIDAELTSNRASADPYAARRKDYLDRRQAEIDAIRGGAKAAAAPAGPVGPVLPPPTPLEPVR